jgi:hypothetical protein
MHLITNDLVIANTSVAYTFNSTRDGLGSKTGFLPITQLQDYMMDDGYGRRVITGANTSLVLKATMATLNPAVTPVVDSSRCGAILVENTINDMPLRNSEIFVTSSGAGYSNTTDITVTITGGGGSGATAVANVVSNTVNSVYITNGGSGYTTSPTITLTPGSGGGSGAAVVYNGEDKQLGGNSNVRYMTRKVILNDGFDSGDLRVYLTAYKPSNANIHVYYKILNRQDTQTFESGSWQLMTKINSSGVSFSQTRDNLYEYVFAPGTSGTDQGYISYTSTTGQVYTTFSQFAIKVVLTTTDNTAVPFVNDLRALALPSNVNTTV